MTLPTSPRTLAERARRGVAAVAAYARESRVDLAIVCALTALAAVLRLWDLGGTPYGLHGDEAWTGIDAQRILDEGWIGPYVRSALGQPAGPLYFTAVLFSFLPDTTWTVRFSMALFGIAAIPLAYATFSLMFDRIVGAFAALILATMTWHLHLSRTGFMVTTWPFMELAVLLALWLALRRGHPALYVATGVLLGLGAYTYNAWILFVPLPFVALTIAYFRLEGRRKRIVHLLSSVAVVMTALLVTVPLLAWITSHEEAYREHQKIVGLTDQERWKDAGMVDRADILLDRTREWGRALVLGDRPDLGDALATEDHPVVDPAVIVLALVGLTLAARNARRPEHAVVIAGCLLLPLGALLTVDDGLFRRTLGLAPFIALLAALPLAWLWRNITGARQYRWRWAVAAGVVLIPAVAGARGVYEYFGPVQDDVWARYVYPYQIDEASRYLGGLPDDTYVYWYSDRWAFDYETRRFHAPGTDGVDRSAEYRSAIDRMAPIDFGNDHPERAVVWVLLDAYVGDVETVVSAYGGGHLTTAVRDGEVLYHAYYLPASEE